MLRFITIPPVSLFSWIRAYTAGVTEDLYEPFCTFQRDGFENVQIIKSVRITEYASSPHAASDNSSLSESKIESESDRLKKQNWEDKISFPSSCQNSQNATLL